MVLEFDEQMGGGWRRGDGVVTERSGWASRGEMDAVLVALSEAILLYHGLLDSLSTRCKVDADEATRLLCWNSG